jgi:GntR family transcriptional regulator
VARQPMYQQIAEDLRQEIESGRLSPGDRLLTESELCDRHNASRNTVRDAIRRLASQGLVETRPGQGTFVTMKTDPCVTVLTAEPRSGFGDGEGTAYLSQVSYEHRVPSMALPRAEIQTPSPEVRRRLRVAPGTHPMDYITRGATRLLMAEDITDGAVRYLADSIDVRQTGYRDWITARVPDSNEQGFFGVSHDASVFEIFRTAFDQTGLPMRVTVTVFPADRNQFIVNAGKNLPDVRHKKEPA